MQSTVDVVLSNLLPPHTLDLFNASANLDCVGWDEMSEEKWEREETNHSNSLINSKRVRKCVFADSFLFSLAKKRTIIDGCGIHHGRELHDAGEQTTELMNFQFFFPPPLHSAKLCTMWNSRLCCCCSPPQHFNACRYCFDTKALVQSQQCRMSRKLCRRFEFELGRCFRCQMTRDFVLHISLQSHQLTKFFIVN